MEQNNQQMQAPSQDENQVQNSDIINENQADQADQESGIFSRVSEAEDENEAELLAEKKEKRKKIIVYASVIVFAIFLVLAFFSKMNELSRKGGNPQKSELSLGLNDLEKEVKNTDEIVFAFESESPKKKNQTTKTKPIQAKVTLAKETQFQKPDESEVEVAAEEQVEETIEPEIQVAKEKEKSKKPIGKKKIIQRQVLVIDPSDIVSAYEEAFSLEEAISKISAKIQEQGISIRKTIFAFKNNAEIQGLDKDTRDDILKKALVKSKAKLETLVRYKKILQESLLQKGTNKKNDVEMELEQILREIAIDVDINSMGASVNSSNQPQTQTEGNKEAFTLD